MERKKHETIKSEDYEYKIQTSIRVINTTDFDIEADIFYDIDEYKITIRKKGS